ncbi:MAG TPA: MFS transporter [Acidimicrobiales bacterium]
MSRTAAADSSTVAHEPTHVPRRAWVVLWLAGLSSALPALNLSVMYVLYPEIEDAFPGVSAARLSWVLNAYTISSSATLVLGGVIADRWGRKRALLWGCTVFGLASVLCAMAPNVPTIIAGRLIIGPAASLIVTANVSIALREFPPTRRSTAFGVLASFGGLAAAAGPSLGSVILLGGWRWGFWMNVPISAVIIVLGLRVFEESRDLTVRRFPDVFSAALLLVSVSLGILAVVQSPTWGWISATTLGSIAASVLLLAAMVWRSLRHPSPIVDLRLFRSRNLSLFNLSSFLVSLGWFGMYLVLVQFLRTTWDYGLIEAGLLVTPIPFGAGVLGPLCGRYADRVGYRPMLLMGALSFAASAVWFITMVDTEPDVAAWMVGIVLVAIGTGLVFPSVQAGSVIGTPPEQYAIATGLNQTIQRVSSALGNAIAVAFIASVGIPAALDRVFVVVLVSSIAIVGAAAALTPAREPVG